MSLLGDRLSLIGDLYGNSSWGRKYLEMGDTYTPMLPPQQANFLLNSNHKAESKYISGYQLERRG